MSVKIKPITDHESYQVNEHTIFKDRLGNWNCIHDLSQKERLAFNRYESIVIKNPRFKKHTATTYKG
ncbi:hypothetical protein [Flavobacterium sp. KACC 22763]|uniref:hypothetical protein n=1 Tax=Flavobacterium sp. KACC 22763 TaxID=3025668 RepID=UPI0023664A21|nr:hypothetical protein [Flavobacterium sp. KACC 22763]WDF64530.1 hypothetical protein PQ463_23345 [Flavobacterium sp. KACC 22763]